MRVTFVLSGLGPGGAERVASLIASGWADDGHHCTIIAFDHPEEPVYHPVSSCVQLVRLGLPARTKGWFGRVCRAVGRLPALRRAIRASEPDLVVSFLTKINALALIATRGIGVPIAVAERNNPQRQDAHPAWNFLLRFLYRFADAIVLQSRASLECLPAGVRDKAVVIPNAIVGPWVQRSISGEPILTAVGRLCYQKGFDLLLPAFAEASEAHPEWRLVIWGEGPNRRALENQAGALGIAPRVSLPGLTDRPGAWGAGASAFVLSSRFEGFPNALGEAMCCGLPVISFACPFGPDEMIVDGQDGLLVPSDDIGALAQALRKVMADPQLRERLGTSARRSAERYAPERVLPMWTEVADRLTSPRPND